MGQISSLFVRKVLTAADEAIDKDSILKGLGLDPADPVDPKHMVSDKDYYAFFEEVQALDSEGISLPLRAGALMSCEDYGAFGLAWKSALSLKGSYERASRYALVLTNVSAYEIEITDSGGLMHLHREGDRRSGLRLSNEATIASIASISREVSENFVADEIYFKHPAPETTSHHETYFGCPVHFDSDKDALLISSELLHSPNRYGDRSFLRFFEQHLETELKELGHEGSLDQKVADQISRRLSEGVPLVNTIASHFGMSDRTLQRRLLDEGYSYRSLVDRARRQLAKRLLKETEYSLAEVAFMTGFSEQSAFTRAFKRWAGETPRSFRLKSI